MCQKWKESKLEVQEVDFALSQVGTLMRLMYLSGGVRLYWEKDRCMEVGLCIEGGVMSR